MLAIDVELRAGVFIGTGSTDLALTGQRASAEWPPSPARLFSALVAGGGTGENNRIGTDDSELRFIEQLEIPEIHASEPGDVEFHEAQTRFVVIDQTKQHGKQSGAVSHVQNYPARGAQEWRGSPSCVPSNCWISYVWPSAELDATTLLALQDRASRVGYFGTSKTPARLRVRNTAAAPTARSRAKWVPTPKGDTELAVPAPGTLETLDYAHDLWTNGSVVRRSHLPIPTAMYGIETEQHSRTTWWFELEQAISPRRCLAVAEAMRGALLRTLTDMYGGTHISKLIHGHDLENGEDYLHIAALPFTGRPYAGGNIRGLALIMPQDVPQEVLDDVTVAGERISSLWLTDNNGKRFIESAIQRSSTHSPKTARQFTWAQASREWKSVTPVVMERRRKGGPSYEDIQTWLSRNGIYADGNYQWSEEPVIEGGWKFHPSEVFRRKDQRRPYGYLRILFDEPVRGPIIVGRGRHHGLGLMMPTDKSGAK